MKNNILKSLLTLILVAFALPMMGQDYLTIYFKDGKTERHLLSLVEKITTSQVDQNGVVHSDYQVQQVWMADTVYTYLFEDIDSVSFRKVDEEQVVHNVESVSSILEQIFSDCESFDEIKSCTEQIKNNQGVEDVFVKNNSIVVRIKDWRDIIIMPSYKDGADYSQYKMESRLSSLISRIRKKSPISQSLSVVIADQNAKNESADYVKSTNALKEIQNTFEGLGYEVDYIPQPDLTFFREKIFNYDLILLTTHGSYDGNLHWFATGEEVGDHGFFFGLSRETTLEWFNSQYDLEDAKFCFIDEIRDNEKRWVMYTACSEDYIRKSPYRFENKNPIIFTNVCESLNGNHSVAEMFIGKGASYYLGYEGSTYLGEYATGEFFCDWMLNGTSVQFAYEHLQDYYTKESETDFEGAVLRIIPEEHSSHFIVNTITAPSSEVKDEISEDGRHTYTVYGYTTMGEDIGVIKGFEFSFNPQMEDSTSAEATTITYMPNNSKGNYRFQVSLRPQKTFYYRAYTYDGLHYNYGDICTFTIDEEEPVSTRELMLAETVGDVEYAIYKDIIDESDYHENPDGWKCYRSKLELDITKNEQTKTYMVDNNIYLDKESAHHWGQVSSMMLDFNKNKMYIFCNSKDEQPYYSMDGNFYESSISSISFTKETVFEGANWGWFPYFCNYNDDQIYLCNFSYAGYFTIMAIRDTNGEWTLYYDNEDISPEDAQKEWSSMPHVLVIGNP